MESMESLRFCYWHRPAKQFLGSVACPERLHLPVLVCCVAGGRRRPDGDVGRLSRYFEQGVQHQLDDYGCSLLEFDVLATRS